MPNPKQVNEQKKRLLAGYQEWILNHIDTGECTYNTSDDSSCDCASIRKNIDDLTETLDAGYLLEKDPES